MFLLSVFSGSLRIVPTSAKTISHLDHEGMPRKVTAVSPTRGEQAEAGGLRGLCLSSRGAQQLHQANVNLDTEIRLPAHLLFLGGESARTPSPRSAIGNNRSHRCSWPRPH